MKYSVLGLTALILSACAPKTVTTGPDNIFTYWIDSAKVPCTGVAPQQCLRVKKGPDFAAAEWQYFYSSIEGFDYEPGNIYQLRVKEAPRNASEPPADASSIIYTLVEVVDKKTDAKLRLHDIWALEAIGGNEMDFSGGTAGIQHPTLELNLTEMRVMGTDGCNNFSGSIKSVTPSELRFGPLAGTRKACRDMTVPDQLNKALTEVAAYQLNGLKLELLDDAGETLLRYRKVD